MSEGKVVGQDRQFVEVEEQVRQFELQAKQEPFDK